MIEADAYPGPSLILSYTPCISQGFPMAESIQHCQMAVDSGYWPLYRYNPEAAAHGNNPFQLDSRKIKGDLFKLLAKDGGRGAGFAKPVAVIQMPCPWPSDCMLSVMSSAALRRTASQP